MDCQILTYMYRSMDPLILVYLHPQIHDSSYLCICTTMDPQILWSLHLQILRFLYLYIHRSAYLRLISAFMDLEIFCSSYFYIYGSSDPSISTSMGPQIPGLYIHISSDPRICICTDLHISAPMDGSGTL